MSKEDRAEETEKIWNVAIPFTGVIYASIPYQEGDTRESIEDLALSLPVRIDASMKPPSGEECDDLTEEENRHIDTVLGDWNWEMLRAICTGNIFNGVINNIDVELEEW